MPKVTMYFHQPQKGEGFPQYAQFLRRIEDAGMRIRQLVADATSTADIDLKVGDVDFIPIPYPQGTLAEYPFSIEIEAIGYPDRKQKLTRDFLGKLKSRIYSELVEARVYDRSAINLDHPTLWVKYQDPDGFHV